MELPRTSQSQPSSFFFWRQDSRLLGQGPEDKVVLLHSRKVFDKVSYNPPVEKARGRAIRWIQK